MASPTCDRASGEPVEHGCRQEWEEVKRQPIPRNTCMQETVCQEHHTHNARNERAVCEEVHVSASIGLELRLLLCQKTLNMRPDGHGIQAPSSLRVHFERSTRVAETGRLELVNRRRIE